MKKYKHKMEHFDTELRTNLKCSKCGMWVSYNNEKGQKFHEDIVNAFMETLKTPKGQEQYKNSRLKRYIDELEGILNEKK
jgi:hypothetical protein